MARIGVIVHLDRAEAGVLARELGAEMAADGHEVLVPLPEADAAGLKDLAVDDANFAVDLDMVVTFGGDGSILRAVELIGESEVPILGVDFGVLGYLTEVRPDDARAAIARVLAGDHQFEERMLVNVETRVVDGDGVGNYVALNEAVVERAADAKHIEVGGAHRR